MLQLELSKSRLLFILRYHCYRKVVDEVNKILLAWIFISIILLLMFLEEENNLDDELTAPGRDEAAVNESGDLLADFENFGVNPAEQV